MSQRSSSDSAARGSLRIMEKRGGIQDGTWRRLRNGGQGMSVRKSSGWNRIDMRIR
jgi:hypothetical protein